MCQSTTVLCRVLLLFVCCLMADLFVGTATSPITSSTNGTSSNNSTTTRITTTGRPDGIIVISVAVVAGAVVIITTVTAAVCYKYKVYNSIRRVRRKSVVTVGSGMYVEDAVVAKPTKPKTRDQPWKEVDGYMKPKISDEPWIEINGYMKPKSPDQPRIEEIDGYLQPVSST